MIAQFLRNRSPSGKPSLGPSLDSRQIRIHATIRLLAPVEGVSDLYGIVLEGGGAEGHTRWAPGKH